jgi:hypothetical protein
MKFTVAAAVAAMATGAMAAHEKGTFAVLRFTGKQLTKGRMDPNVSPGKPSKHVHSIQGGSGFSMSATGADMVKSKCSTAMVKGDNSAYWYPALYFKDPNNGSIESVNINYVNAYYFFEKSHDDIKAFPVGLQMISGDPNVRTPPKTSKTILDLSDDGPIQPIKWTCPRLNNEYNPPSWDADSDGLLSGMGDPINKGEGVGFPDQNCDGTYSPLRADIHFPSCYNPKAGLTADGKNMAWPTINDGYKDCPEGYIHVPHLFIEVYWDTPDFKDRWTPGVHEQPFVLSNGDATGYSSHADFLGGWDEELLQHIIDTCNAGTSGMDKCPGLFYGLNEDKCSIESEVDEQVDGVMDSLPGGNVMQGWSYGTSSTPVSQEPEEPEAPEEPTTSSKPSKPTTSSEPETSEKPKETKASILPGLPDVTNVVENPAIITSASAPAPTAPVAEAPAPAPTSAAVEAPAPGPKEDEEPASSSVKCKTKVEWETVWETVYVTADEAAATEVPQAPKKARRSHLQHHRRHHA